MRHLLDTKVGDYQAMVPMVDIDTIGAGGGSIAYVDEGGVFRVGPQSAGADPGPGLLRARRHASRPRPTRSSCSGACGPIAACSAATCTLDVRPRARRRCASVAEQLGMTVEEAALGALQIQKFGMTQAIELNSVRRGYDPREFTLVAAGGAGPLFACDIALELEIPRVLVPPHPGIIAATGLLATDLQHEFVATERHALKSLDRERLQARFDELVRAGRRAARRATPCRRTGGWCGASPTAATRARATRCASTCRPATIDDDWIEELAEGFHARPRGRVRAPLRRQDRGHQHPRGRRSAASPSSSWTELEARRRRSVGALTLERDVVFDVDGGRQRSATPFYDARPLRAGDRIAGPGGDRAVRHHHGRSRPGSTAEIDRYGNIVIDCTSAREAPSAAEPAALATPILMRVIGGAFQSIAKEMAGVLYRMSYSSIIRESEDLGAASSTPTATSWPSPTRPRCSWARCRRSSRA